MNTSSSLWGWKRIFLEMESLMRLYRPVCDFDGCKPQTTARRILAATKFPASKLPRIVNLKTVEANGFSVFIFADLREVKKWRA